ILSIEKTVKFFRCSFSLEQSISTSLAATGDISVSLPVDLTRRSNLLITRARAQMTQYRCT
ncbi:hypothetical protein pdam_00008349, partial [Pocillopora damicornis]